MVCDGSEEVTRRPPGTVSTDAVFETDFYMIFAELVLS